MLNKNTELAFLNFIEVLEQETGIKPNSIAFNVHRASKEQCENVLALNGAHVQEGTGFINTDDFAPEGIINGVRLDFSAYPNQEIREYYLSLAKKDKEEDAFVQCDLCEEDFPSDERHEAFSPNENKCKSCGDQLMEEWEQEDQEMKSNYYKDVL